MNLSNMDFGLLVITGCFRNSSIFLVCLKIKALLVSCLPLGDFKSELASLDCSVKGQAADESSVFTWISVTLFFGTLTSLVGLAGTRLVPSSSLL